MMKLIVGLALIVVLVGIGYYLGRGEIPVPSFGTPSTTTVETTKSVQTSGVVKTETIPKTGTATPVPTSNAKTAPNGSGMGTLKSLMSYSGNYTCSFDYSDKAGRSHGTIYSTTGKRRVDFEYNNTASGKTTSAHTITLGVTVYSWVDGVLSGFKTAAEATLLLPASMSAAGFVSEIIPGMNWSCHPWIVDTKLLPIPKEITFIVG